jgi:hypothetical protein
MVTCEAAVHGMMWFVTTRFAADVIYILLHDAQQLKGPAAWHRAFA